MESMSPSTATFESIQSQANSIRRARPPDIIVRDENRVPLRVDSRSERMSKRESRIGFRSIFGRPKTGKDTDGKELDRPASSREPSRSRGARASLAEVSNWPSGLHQSRSELSLSSPPESSRSASSGLQSQRSTPRLRSSDARAKPSPAASNLSPRAWTPSPLFQVYPQAVKHATLPACTASVDALLRLNSSRNSASVHDGPAVEETRDHQNDKKRLHQRGGSSRNLLDWTIKTYVLITSGFLLQYSSEGSFDRLPEKCLRLTKDSAAFASDLIPGKHWVIQVVASMDADGNPATDSKSLFAKLAHRGSGKKDVSTFLMVFDRATDMDSWLAILRREIEELGGKKQLSETGEPRADDLTNELKTHPSQRTIVVRDPDRFSTMIQQDFSWSNEKALTERDHHGLPPMFSSEGTAEAPLDDLSATDSHYSSDGQRLDSLRDSNNRLSYISSGQRTFVTSANSSPANSPLRTSFASLGDEPKVYPSTQDNHAEVRLRPNAQAIASRRQSMQTLSNFDGRTDQSSRPHSYINHGTENNEARRSIVPNFSKRFSTSKPLPADPPIDQALAFDQDQAGKTARKPPPTALVMSRPLSTVLDLPSPSTPSSQPPWEPLGNFQSVHPPNSVTQKPSTPPKPTPSARRTSQVSASPAESHATPQYQTSPGGTRISPRRFASMTNLRTSQEIYADQEVKAPRFVLSSSVMAPKPQVRSSWTLADESPRTFSSLSKYGPDRKLATSPATKFPSYNRRGTFMAEESPFSRGRHSFAQADAHNLETESRFTPPRDSHTKQHDQTSILSSKIPFSGTESRARSLAVRRSMPQLVDGPPLAPPPTRALPPIPKRH